MQTYFLSTKINWLGALCSPFGAILHKLSFTFSSDTLDKDDLNKIQIEDASITAGCCIFLLYFIGPKCSKDILGKVHESGDVLLRLNRPKYD